MTMMVQLTDEDRKEFKVDARDVSALTSGYTEGYTYIYLKSGSCLSVKLHLRAVWQAFYGLRTHECCLHTVRVRDALLEEERKQ